MAELQGIAADICRVVQQVNSAWQTGQCDNLVELFHQRAVIVDGAHQRLAVGQGECVASYRAFVASATVEHYAEGPATVDEFGGTGVVSYPFEMRYTTGGKTFTEAGSDCLVLRHGAAGWQVVWRQLVWRG